MSVFLATYMLCPLLTRQSSQTRRSVRLLRCNVALCSCAPGSIVTMTTRFLSNGQAYEYPITWCVPVALCFEAVSFFFRSAGQRAESIAWHAA